MDLPTSPEKQNPNQNIPQTPASVPTTSYKSNPRPNDNVIFVGSKPLMNYVTSIAIQFQKGNSSEVIVKARGKFISKAVDIVEVSRKRFLEDQNISIKDIKINTEKYEKEGRKINVSTIDLVLSK